MDFIIDAIVEWLKGLLVDGIMGNLDGLFDNVNQSVGEIATQVGTTPADWNAGVFSMIRQISETAILPIAGVILTFVMTYELIQMLIERNNLHEVDTWMFFKWVFKTFVAVMILTNTFNIVLAVFDVSQYVIQQSAGIIQNGTEITPDVLDSLRTELEAMELGPLFGLWLQSFLIQLTMIALNIVIFVIVYGRMIEIYLLTSLAPIPFATVPNRETLSVGRDFNGGEDTGPSYELPGEALDDPAFAALMEEATKYIGWPYVWGGSSPSTSFDCSGFVCWVYTASGVTTCPVPRRRAFIISVLSFPPPRQSPATLSFSREPMTAPALYPMWGFMWATG